MAETVLRFAQGYDAETLITAPEEKQECNPKDDSIYDNTVRHTVPPYLFLCAQFFDAAGDGGDYLKDISNDAIRGYLEDGCLFVVIDGDDDI